MLDSIHVRVYFRREKIFLLWSVSVKSIHIYFVSIFDTTHKFTTLRHSKLVYFVTGIIGMDITYWKKYRNIFLSEGVMFHVDVYSSMILMSSILFQKQYPPISGWRAILENHRYLRCIINKARMVVVIPDVCLTMFLQSCRLHKIILLSLLSADFIKNSQRGRIMQMGTELKVNEGRVLRQVCLGVTSFLVTDAYWFHR